MFTDPEAFDVELMEIDQISQEMAIISAARQALEEERKKEPHKRRYIRLARQYVPELRKIFWRGELKEEAQEILGVLMLEQSNPTSSIDDHYDGDGDDYVEVDSYTGERVEDPEAHLQNQWERDYIEVQREMKWQEEHSEIQMLDEDAYDLYRLLFTLDADPIAVSHELIPYGQPSIKARIAQEYTGSAREQAINANYYDWIENDDVDHWDDRGISSVPLIQNEEMELKTDVATLADLRRKAMPFVNAIRERRSEWIELAKATKLKGNWKLMFQKVLMPSVERSDFLEFLQSVADEYEPQYLYRVFMSMQGEWGLPLKDAWSIKIKEDTGFPQTAGRAPGWWGTLAGIHYMFGEQILDEDLDPVGRSGTMSTSEIFAWVETWDNEIVDTFSDDPNAKASATRAYMRGIFDALGQYDADLHEAGMTAWRKWRQPQAELAYRIALEKGDRRAAWRAFWNCAEVIRVSRDGVVVRTLVKGEEQKLNYALAAWKMARRELIVPPDKKERLIELLTTNKWGYKLLNAVRGGA